MSKFQPIETTKSKLNNNEVPSTDGAFIVCTDGGIYVDNASGRHYIADKPEENTLKLQYIWYANKNAVASISAPLTKIGGIKDFKQPGNVFAVMAASSVTLNVIVPSSASTVTPSVTLGGYTLFNNGDLIAYVGDFSSFSSLISAFGGEPEIWKRIPMHEAKTNLDGLMSAWDKTQVNKIPTMESNLSNLENILTKERLPVYTCDKSAASPGHLVNWLFDDGWYVGGIKKDCGGHPPVLNENHTSWAVLVLNGMNTNADSPNFNHRLQIAFDLVNSKIYMRRGWISSNTWADHWTDTAATAEKAIPAFTFIQNAAITTQSGNWTSSYCRCYVEEFTYDDHYTRKFLIEMDVIPSVASSQFSFRITDIADLYDIHSMTPLNVGSVNGSGYVEPACGVLGTRLGDFDINFYNQISSSVYLQIAFTQFEKIE